MTCVLPSPSFVRRTTTVLVLAGALAGCSATPAGTATSSSTSGTSASDAGTLTILVTNDDGVGPCAKSGWALSSTPWLAAKAGMPRCTAAAAAPTVPEIAAKGPKQHASSPFCNGLVPRHGES